jgi:KUP system potassium uptake protein
MRAYAAEYLVADAVSSPSHSDDDEAGHAHVGGAFSTLVIGASGVVFGDIGTSPLYALQATMAGAHPLAVNVINIYGVISLIFWSLISVVTIKYVFTIMHADNNGEGGSLALLALIKRKLGAEGNISWLVILGLFATALFYSDSMITPAVSVISAVEGLDVVNHSFKPFVVPISLIILFGLFVIQSRGTAMVGKLFGPVMLIYFIVIAVMGIVNILPHPQVLWALNPYYIIPFFTAHPLLSFLSLGAVIYAATGAEALYADMGHFGRKPIMMAWLYIVFPALILNYMGQAALMITQPDTVANPFFHMVPAGYLWPLVILATMATIIASQAVISGAYSVTQQAIQLGFMPRLRITHTSSDAAGQIYVPIVNWGLLVMVAILILTFRSSANLLPAYGLAVVGTMLITTIMMGVMIFRIWKVNFWLGLLGVSVFLVVDSLYLASGLAKLFEGAWFPILVGMVIFTLLTTWSAGRKLMQARLDESALPITVFIRSASNSATRVAGTAVFMTSTPDGVPPALLHNLKHNKVLHERIILLTVKTIGVPVVPEDERCRMEDLGQGFHRLVLRYGFMQETDVPAALKLVKSCGADFNMMDTSFFLARQTLLPSARPGMAIWREHLFSWMLRNAEGAMAFFRLPTNRVVELGSQVEI